MYLKNLKAFLEREEAKKALERKAVQKDPVESTTYDKRKKIGPYWLLCNPVDHPEVWAPSSGKKNYELIIDGEPYEFHKEMTGKQFEHLNTEADISAEVNLTPPANNPDSTSSDLENRDAPQSVDSQISDQVVTSTVKVEALNKSDVLRKIQFILEQSQVQPNRILRAIQTLNSILEKTSRTSSLIDRVKSALHYEGIETWVVDKVIGELKSEIDGESNQKNPDLIYLVEDANALKAKIEAHKPAFAQNLEKSKALDDATSACDLVVHHILDIMEDTQTKEPLMAKLRFHANPVNVNVADEVKPGDVLSFGDKALLKIINIFVDLKENLVKVKWTEKHEEGVLTHEESLPTFRQRLQTLKRIYNASVK